jgi:hypothetical protein
MRCVNLQLPLGLVRDARLYAANPNDLDAVCHVIHDYGRLVKQIRDLRARLSDLDNEAAAFDQRLERLQVAARALLDL